MAHATIEDLAVFAGDRYLNEVDRKTAEKLIEYASAVIDMRFADAKKSASDVESVILSGVVCNMALRVMDSFKKADDNAQNAYETDPFASTSYFNYRGKMEPSRDELISLGLPVKRTRIGSAGFACL